MIAAFPEAIASSYRSYAFSLSAIFVSMTLSSIVALNLEMRVVASNGKTYVHSIGSFLLELM